jgi:hypothetical protein
MDLLTPRYGLILFQLTILITILLFITSWITILLAKRLESGKKLVWLLGTLFLPVIGPLAFFILLKNMSKNNLSTDRLA